MKLKSSFDKIGASDALKQRADEDDDRQAKIIRGGLGRWRCQSREDSQERKPKIQEIVVFSQEEEASEHSKKARRVEIKSSDFDEKMSEKNCQGSFWKKQIDRGWREATTWITNKWRAKWQFWGN